MTGKLVVLADGRRMGTVEQRRGGQLTFAYDESWSGPSAYPLSLSMPIAGNVHGHAQVHPFLANLLPDNENTLSSWAKEHHTSTDPFALLRYRGEDCPGAIQLVQEERVEAVLSGEGDGFEPLDDTEIAARLRDVREAARTGRQTSNSGQFSLAGAQPKISLARHGAEWGVPTGRTPTTHILKPSDSKDGFEINEHFCLELADALGLPTARSEIRSFDGETAIVVTRFDRVRRDETHRRLHQEDLCQVLGVHPHSKYQNEGGPTPRQINDAILEASSRPAEDSFRFTEALLYNYVIGGTDAHAKNYSVLLPDAVTVRLSPLYDLASALPHFDVKSRRVKFAMKIESHYSLRDVSLHDWRKQAKELRVGEARLLARLQEMLQELPDAIGDVAKHCRAAGLRHPVLKRLGESLRGRAAQIEKELGVR